MRKITILQVWELALLLALAVDHSVGRGFPGAARRSWAGRSSASTSSPTPTRPEDQALKLRVRDRVLARAQEILEQSADMAQARSRS